jgi:nicotinate dehydrogenase subunit A
MKLALNVNGKAVSVQVDDREMPLLYALRDDLALHGPRFGLVDGRAVRSCSVPVGSMTGKKVVTLEGLGTPTKLHPLQQAFIDEQAVQCGYCINGMIMQAAAFLQTNKKPTEAQIREALAGNLCRCGTHLRIVRAVKRASESMA